MRKKVVDRRHKSLFDDYILTHPDGMGTNGHMTSMGNRHDGWNHDSSFFRCYFFIAALLLHQ